MIQNEMPQEVLSDFLGHFKITFWITARFYIGKQ